LLVKRSIKELIQTAYQINNKRMKNLKRFTYDKGAANIIASNKGYDNHLLRLQGIYRDPDGSLARRKHWRQFSEQDKRVISQVKEKKRDMFLINMISRRV
jgi:hypothetical protein